MKLFKVLSLSVLMITGVFAMQSCSSDDDATSDATDPTESCYVHLYDGDNFKDDHIVVEGPGEFPDLSNLPGADGKDWTDEADSFKVGENTTLTVWTQTNFEGDSTVYETGNYPSVDEPYSMKIKCEE